MAKKGIEDRGQGLGLREVLMAWSGGYRECFGPSAGGVPHSVGRSAMRLPLNPTGFHVSADERTATSALTRRRDADARARCAKAVAKVKAMLDFKPWASSFTHRRHHASFQASRIDNADKVFARPACHQLTCPASTTIIDQERVKGISKLNVSRAEVRRLYSMTIRPSSFIVSVTSSY